MDQQTATRLDRLLANGELSRPEAEAIFERVYATIAREEPPRRLWSGSLLAAGGLAAAAALFLLLRPATEPPAEWTARGVAATDTAAMLELRCSDGRLSACPLSSKLVFLVSGEADAGFLSAYAEPLEAGMERVWYFSREAHSPELALPLNGTHVFDRGVSLAGSHRAGRYRVHAFLSDQPLTHAELLAGPPSQRVRASLHTEITLTEEERQ
jgi:hypothetical protein